MVGCASVHEVRRTLVLLNRQVLGAVAEFEKAMTVAKLRGARDRKRATGVKVEGRKRIAE